MTTSWAPLVSMTINAQSGTRRSLGASSTPSKHRSKRQRPADRGLLNDRLFASPMSWVGPPNAVDRYGIRRFAASTLVIGFVLNAIAACGA
jgi:hypothetical protein